MRLFALLATLTLRLAGCGSGGTTTATGGAGHSQGANPTASLQAVLDLGPSARAVVTRFPDTVASSSWVTLQVVGTFTGGSQRITFANAFANGFDVTTGLSF